MLQNILLYGYALDCSATWSDILILLTDFAVLIFERYTHLNVEFQRIARRDKKGFLSDQCKEREENNRIGKDKRSLQEN